MRATYVAVICCFIILGCFPLRAVADVSGATTHGSANGQVEIRKEFPSGKVTVVRPTPAELSIHEAHAKNGDVDAQLILADLAYETDNFQAAESWMRSAARQGDIYAQYILGLRLAAPLMPGPKRPEEGAAWLKLAAYQGYHCAAAELSDLYYRGRGVETNRLQAYVWALITERGWPFISTDPQQAEQERQRWKARKERLHKSLSATDIENAKSQAETFKPVDSGRNPLIDCDWIRVSAISESEGRPIAVINGTAFTVGEKKEVPLLSYLVPVTCVTITSNTVTIATPPYGLRGELRVPYFYRK